MASPSTSFDEEAKRRGLKDHNIERLKDAGYDDFNALACSNEDDLKHIKITIAQRKIVKKWANDIKSSTGRPSSVLDLQTASEAVFECQKTFIPLAKEHHVNDATIVKLAQEDCNTLDSLLEIDLKDLYDMQITRAQISILRSWKCGMKIIKDSRNQRMPSHPYNAVATEHIQRIPTEEEVTATLKSLNITERAKTDLSQHINNNGVDGLKVKLKTQLNEFLTLPVIIGVTGRSGTGKSSLINTLRNLHPKDPDAAKVGVTETTMQVMRYPHPQLDKVELLDLPGINTPNFPKDSYLSKVNFKSYDAFIIVTTERFTGDDLWLAQEAHKLKVPFYFVRSKIDIDVCNSRRESNITENQVLWKIRSQIQAYLTDKDLPGDRIFLISTKLDSQTKWDFPRLAQDLVEKTPGKNQQALVLAMVSCSKEVIEKKVNELQKRINDVSLQSLLILDSDALLQEEIKFYTERLGITESDLAQVDTSNFADNLKETIDNLTVANGTDVWYWVEMNGFLYWIRGVFSTQSYIDETKDAEDRKQSEINQKLTAVQHVLQQVLRKCHELAEAVVNAKDLLSEP